MKYLIIVRHAERPDILPDRVGDDVMLTDKGIEQSKAFVSLIDLPILSVKSSPIKRCVQTAKLIAQSANEVTTRTTISRVVDSEGGE